MFLIVNFLLKLKMECCGLGFEIIREMSLTHVKIRKTMYLKVLYKDWKYSLEVWRSCCLCRSPWYMSPYPHGVSQLDIVPVSGYLTHSSGFNGSGEWENRWKTSTHASKTIINKNNKINSKTPDEALYTMQIRTKTQKSVLM